MRGISIYIEGGGGTRDLQTALRLGFDRLLEPQKESARQKRLHWKLVCEGGRNQAFDAFRNAVRQSPRDLNVLLVDAEEPCQLGPVQVDEMTEARTRLAHLQQRDPWDFTGIDGRRVHLMVRMMESWIVSDPEALSGFYGQGFNSNLLPARLNLEEEPKDSLSSGLANATRQSRTKGQYAKRLHAAALLPLLDRSKVARRCPRFGVFLAWLDRSIAVAP